MAASPLPPARASHKKPGRRARRWRPSACSRVPAVQKCNIVSRYRDRASERRQGVSLDYADVVEVRCSNFVTAPRFQFHSYAPCSRQRS
jgi:hypothetical protein